MKKFIYLSCMLLSFNSLAQVVSFHPVKVPAEQLETFLDIETNYMSKIAQKAVNDGDLMGWRLLELFNPGSGDFNYMFVNIHKDFDAIASPKAAWWTNANEVLGVKADILLNIYQDFEYDRQYFYEVKEQIPLTQPSKYILLNFASPDDVELQISEVNKYVVPHFKKHMDKHGMVGWGVGTKITPQGKEFSSIMFWDSYDSLANVMKHLGGYGVVEGLPFDKFSDPVKWENRYIFKVIASTKE